MDQRHNVAGHTGGGVDSCGATRAVTHFSLTRGLTMYKTEKQAMQVATEMAKKLGHEFTPHTECFGLYGYAPYCVRKTLAVYESIHTHGKYWAAFDASDVPCIQNTERYYDTPCAARDAAIRIRQELLHTLKNDMQS